MLKNKVENANVNITRFQSESVTAFENHLL